jgi:hypothetical protein
VILHHFIANSSGKIHSGKDKVCHSGFKNNIIWLFQQIMIRKGIIVESNAGGYAGIIGAAALIPE